MATGDPVLLPDLSERPLTRVVECDLAAPPEALYDTWIDRLDTWFAARGTVALRAQLSAAAVAVGPQR